MKALLFLLGIALVAILLDWVAGRLRPRKLDEYFLIPIDPPQPQGYLCEGGSHCEHGCESTHWVDL